METQSRKKGKRYLVWILIILLLPVVIAFVLYFSLPFLIELTAPAVARNFGIANFAIKVHEASWDDIDIRDIEAGVKGRKGVKFGKVIFQRSNSRSRPNKILVTDAEIHLSAMNGKVFIPGITLPASNPKLDIDTPVSLTSLLKIPGALALFSDPSLEIEIKNSELFFSRITRIGEEVNIKLPVHLIFSIDKKGSFYLKMEGEKKDLAEVPYLPAEMSCAKLSYLFETEGVLHKDKSCEDVTANFAITLVGLKYQKDKKQSMMIPELSLTGSVWQEEEELNGEIAAKFANAEFKTETLKLSQISAELPLEFVVNEKVNFPSAESADPGMLKIGRIQFKNKNLGKAELNYQQAGSDFIIRGLMLPVFLKDMTPESGIVISGNAVVPWNEKEFRTACHLELDCQKVKFDIGEFASKVKGMFFEGNANLTADVEYVKGRLLTSANLAITDSRIEQKEKGLLAEELNLGFNFPDLTKIQSSPAQQLTFKSFKYGELKFGEGELQFQLESKRSLFLERSDVEWCEGHMDFGAVRIDFAKPENIDFTFFCDRINVAEFLNQLKVAKASGGGAVAGRIPVKFLDGKLVIKNGFLYSTPGEGGRIQLTDFAGSELADTSIQLAIAREALKDYNYKWIRITFNTLKDSLTIKLELDGAPNGRLPFTFDEETVFKKTQQGDVKAKFQAISFDINLNIPIEDIIYYGRKTSSLFK